MFVEKKVIHAACLAAFTGDWDLDLESLFTAATAIPIKSTVGIAPSTRRFMSYDTITGYTTHIYHIGALIISGADDLRYKVQLICSADNSCSSADGFENGVCDCAHSGVAEQSLDITGQFGTGSLDSGETLNEERFIQLSAGESYSRYRYDKTKITYTYKGNDGETHTEEKVVDIRQIGGAPPAECMFDIGGPSFICSFNIGVNTGDAWFETFDDNLENVYLDQKIPFEYTGKLEGERDNKLIHKFLTAEVRNQNGGIVDQSWEKKITSTEFESTESSPWPSIKVEKGHFGVVGYSNTKCDVGSHTANIFDTSKIESEGICEFSVCLKYDSSGGWKAYNVEIKSTGEADCTDTENTGISCSQSGEEIECETKSSSGSQKVKIFLNDGAADNSGHHIALKGEIADSTETTTSTCTDTDEQKWTAEFKLYYPKVDSDGSLSSSEKGNVVVHDGNLQQKTVEFDVECNKADASATKSEISNIVLSHSESFEPRLEYDETSKIYKVKNADKDKNIHLSLTITSNTDIRGVDANANAMTYVSGSSGEYNYLTDLGNELFKDAESASVEITAEHDGKLNITAWDERGNDGSKVITIKVEDKEAISKTVDNMFSQLDIEFVEGATEKDYDGEIKGALSFLLDKFGDPFYNEKITMQITDDLHTAKVIWFDNAQRIIKTAEMNLEEDTERYFLVHELFHAFYQTNDFIKANPDFISEGLAVYAEYKYRYGRTMNDEQIKNKMEAEANTLSFSKSQINFDESFNSYSETDLDFMYIASGYFFFSQPGISKTKIRSILETGNGFNTKQTFADLLSFYELEV